MRKIILLAAAVLLAVLGVTVILNWKPRTYQVTGTITRGGKPLQWKGEKRVLQVIFGPTDRAQDRNVYRCEGDPEEGTYVLEGIPAGKYRVSIQQLDPYPMHDLLNFAYSLKDSPFVYDVAGDCKIDIDLPGELPRGGRRPTP